MPTLDGVALVPLIIALVTICKRVPGYVEWMGPWLALGLGVLFMVTWEATDASHTGRDWLLAVVYGLVYGATAAGVYDAGRTVAHGVTRRGR